MRDSISHRALLVATLVPTAATTLALIPLLIIDMSERPPIAVIVVFFVLAPLVALLVNWRWPQATTDRRAAIAALPQPVVVIVMFRLGTWLEYRDYFLEDSSEEAMAYGIGFILSLFLGVIMFLLVYTGGWLARR